NTTHGRSGSLNTRQWKALGIAAALLVLSTAGCTDATVAPKSTVTGANFFDDPGSYQAFLAKIYGGLALSGQSGPAGQPDMSGIDEGFSQYLRLYWETEELPTDEAVIAWNDIGLPEMNTQTWTASSAMVVAMYYRIFFQAGMTNEFLRQTTDDKLTARGVSSQLLAELYLNDSVYTGTANWAGALTEAQAVIGSTYTLDPNYRHLFTADNNTSPEIIFAITQDGVHTQTYGGVTFLVHASVGGSMNA